MMTVNTLPTDYRLLNQCETNMVSEGFNGYTDMIEVRASVSGYDTDLAVPAVTPVFHYDRHCDDE